MALLIDVVTHSVTGVTNELFEIIEKLPKEKQQRIINAVRALDELESHGVGSVLAIFDAASWAKLAFATERNKFKVTAFGTGIHCTAESRVTAVNHFCYVINDNLTWMQDVYHFFVMVIKNVLEYVHKIIMTQKKKKENPTPQD